MNLLGETISFLTEKGARILDVETEKATLLTFWKVTND